MDTRVKTRAPAARQTRPAAEVPASGPRSLHRVFRLLEVLAQATEGMSLSELSDAVRAPKSSLLMLLRPLAASKVLTHAGNRYALGPAMFHLAARILVAHRFPRNMHSHLEDLSRRTGETAFIAVLDRDAKLVTYVDAIPSPHDVSVNVSIGYSRPLHSTSSGQALLAFTDSVWFDGYLAGAKLTAQTRTTITRRTELRRRIEQIRADGYACSIDEQALGASGISAPVYDASGRLIAVLAVVAPTARLKPRVKQFAAWVKEIAAAASGRSIGSN